MENNPNMIDSLFTPINCVLYSSKIADLVRDNRQLFLHKGAWFKFKNYSFSQLHKMKNKKINNLITLCSKLDISLDEISFNDIKEEMEKRKLLC